MQDCVTPLYTGFASFVPDWSSRTRTRWPLHGLILKSNGNSLSCSSLHIVFSQPHVSESTSGKALGGCATIGVSPWLIPPHSVVKHYKNLLHFFGFFTPSPLVTVTLTQLISTVMCFWGTPSPLPVQISSAGLGMVRPNRG